MIHQHNELGAPLLCGSPAPHGAGYPCLCPWFPSPLALRSLPSLFLSRETMVVVLYPVFSAARVSPDIPGSQKPVPPRLPLVSSPLLFVNLPLLPHLQPSLPLHLHTSLLPLSTQPWIRSLCPRLLSDPYSPCGPVSGSASSACPSKQCANPFPEVSIVSDEVPSLAISGLVDVFGHSVDEVFRLPGGVLPCASPGNSSAPEQGVSTIPKIAINNLHRVLPVVLNSDVPADIPHDSSGAQLIPLLS